MRPLVPFVLCAAFGLTACSTIGNSRYNPLNWFGSSTAVATTPVDPQTGEARPLVTPSQFAGPVDDRDLIPEVTGLVIEQTPDGAIIRASGVAPTQGYYNAQLVRTTLQDGVLTYEFRANDPETPAPTGSIASRTLNVATTVGSATLNTVRTVRVVGDTTSRIVSR